MTLHLKNLSPFEKRQELRERYRRGQISRRDFVRWSAVLGVSAPHLLGAGRAAPAAAQEPGVLRVSFELEPESLNKPAETTQNSTYVTQQLYAQLVRGNIEGEIVPDFAERWEVSPDGTVYTFHLHRGVLWSDGSREITAEDVKYTWDRYFWPETESPYPGWGLEDVVGWQAAKDGETRDLAGAQPLDEYTFQVTLAQPSGVFLDLINYPELGIVKRENVESGTDGDPWWRRPESSGPFVLESWTTGQELTLVPNPHYFGTQPALERVIYRFIPDASARTLAYENGDLDIIVPSEADIRAALEQGRFEGQLVHDETLSYSFLVFKMAAPPVDDLHVRRALTLAIDRELLSEAVLKGAYEPALGWTPPDAPWYNPDLDYLAFDPERAREEAAQSTYGDPAQWPPIDFLVVASPTPTVENRLAAAIQSMWQEHLGIAVQIKGVEDAWQASQDRQGQIFFWGLGQGYYDPHYVMDSNALCAGWNNAWTTGYETPEGDYVDGYCNPELDELILAARSETDPEKRLQMYQEAEQMFVLDASMLPINIGYNYFLVKPYVKGLEFMPTGAIHLETVSIEV